MTGYERIKNMLEHKPQDRIPVYEHFWSDTYKDYVSKGHIKEGESFYDHFDFDMQEYWAFNLVADLDYQNEIISESDDTITVKDGNGAILRKHKKHDATPEHIDFTVKTMKDWEKLKPLLSKIDTRRIKFKEYREAKKAAKEKNRYFVWSGVNVFESIHPVCGHENMLVAMALEPEMILDMAETYAKLIIGLQEILFEQEGYPDGIWYYEDMGFKERPFMSPSMYQELIMPYHKYTIDYAHKHNMPVIMHSCGFVEPLLPYMIEAGIDCLQVIEIKAGMDLLRIYEKYGDKIALMGGIDVRVLYTNDKKQIDEELQKKIPIVKGKFGYCLHSDHSIPKTVDYDIYKYFINKGIELGKADLC